MPFRANIFICPGCSKSLQLPGARPPTVFCPACRGAWVNMTSLREKLAAMTNQLEPPSIDFFRRGGDEERSCADCRAPMLRAFLHGVAIERCEAHGVWLDAGELQTVLARAAGLRDESDPSLGVDPDGVDLALDGLASWWLS